MRMSISLFTVFLLTALLIGVEGYEDPEGYNTHWASKRVYDTHVNGHAGQHGGVNTYLQGSKFAKYLRNICENPWWSHNFTAFVVASLLGQAF